MLFENFIGKLEGIQKIFILKSIEKIFWNQGTIFIFFHKLINGMIQVEVYFLNFLFCLVLGVVGVFGVVGLGDFVFVPLLCLTFFNVVLPVDGVVGVVVAFVLCTLATFGKAF